MKTVDVLKGARERIAAGWCRGQEHTVIRGKDHFCLVGAVRDTTGRRAEQHRALVRIAEALPTEGAYYLIWRWNDHRAKSKRDVLRVLDRAIEACS